MRSYIIIMYSFFHISSVTGLFVLWSVLKATLILASYIIRPVSL